MGVSRIFVRNLSRTMSSEGQRMKAWQLHAYSDASKLQLDDVRVPTITKPGEVLVKVHAASLNPIDAIMLEGYGRTIINRMRNGEPEFPLLVGREFAGIVVDRGEEVDNSIQVGDAVYGVVPVQKRGSLAEMVLVDGSTVLPRPQQLTDVESSSLLYVSLTIWSALYLSGKLDSRPPEKQRVLILGASGGVGTIAIQILKSQKVTVFGTCSANAADMVKSLGADKICDYADVNALKELGKEGEFDIILDCAKIGYNNLPSTWKYRRYVTLDSPLMVNTDKHGLILGLMSSFGSLLKANKCFFGRSVSWGFFKPEKKGLDFIDALVKNEKIKPVVQKVFKFDEVPEAFSFLNAGHLRGKVVIDFK